MVFDGDCGFCKFWIARWHRATGDRVDYIPFQDATVEDKFPEIPREHFDKSVQLIEPDGLVYHGAEAALRSLATNPKKRWTLWLYEKIPGVAPLTEIFYRIVASNRSFFSALTRFVFGKKSEQK